jgi:hypothetical protein
MSNQSPPAIADDRPWERPGAVRRDRLPDRARLLRGLGEASFALALLLFCIPLSGLFALPAAVTVSVLARRDLAEMAAGRVDLGARWRVQRAQAAAGTALGLAFRNLLYAAVLFARLGW